MMNALNKSQKSVMELITQMQRPDVGEARTLRHLAENIGLPPRVTTQIEHYIELARDAGNKALEAKEAGQEASKAWQSVKEQANRDDDLVDLAENVTAQAPTEEEQEEAMSDSDALIEDIEFECGSELVTFLTNFEVRYQGRAFLKEFKLHTEDEGVMDVTRMLRHLLIFLLNRKFDSKGWGNYRHKLSWLLHYFLQNGANVECPELDKNIQPFLKFACPVVLDAFKNSDELELHDIPNLEIAKWVGIRYAKSGICSPSALSNITEELSKRNFAKGDEAEDSDDADAPSVAGKSLPPFGELPEEVQDKMNSLKGLAKAKFQGGWAAILEIQNCESYAVPYNAKNYVKSYEEGFKEALDSHRDGHNSSDVETGPLNKHHLDPSRKAWYLGRDSVERNQDQEVEAE